MRLRGIDFGYTLNASGARGFLGEGYWFHKYLRPFGLEYAGTSFVSKTVTISRQESDVLLEGVSPKDKFPKTIRVYPHKGVVLHAGGMSNPGAAYVLKQWVLGRDGLPPGPRVLSFSSVATSDPNACIAEAQAFCRLFQTYVPAGHILREDGIALQFNLSPPKNGVPLGRLLRVGLDTLEAAGRLQVPVLVKVNATLSPELVQVLSTHEACDAVVCSDTIPWGQLPDRIDWKGLFGVDRAGTPLNPLANFGGAGISGAPLLPIVCDWIREARKAGLRKPIVGGGGILSLGVAVSFRLRTLLKS